jgi:16S rRNA (uracil1498-N3)-methyltransferase
MIQGSTISITDHDVIHQWKRVFRYTTGSRVIVFDGHGSEYLSIISRMAPSGVELSILETKSIQPPVKRIVLCMSLIKKDNIDVVVQKAVELGVSEIIPVLSEHSEKKKINLIRLKKIIIEACEQSGRADIPVIHDVVTLEALFHTGILPQEKVVCHTDSRTSMPFSTYVARNTKNVALFIGPEGGFSPQEITFFEKYNVVKVSLSSHVLRAETAAIAALSGFLLS